LQVTLSDGFSLGRLRQQRDRPRTALRTVGRVALWTAIAVVLVRGLGAIASDPAETPAADDAQAAAVRFPDDEARTFAVRFVRAYLNPSRGGEVTHFLADDLSDRTAVVPSRRPGAGVANAQTAARRRFRRPRAQR
jgi:hypothetical protein